ncbi:MAG: hypothetical protein H0W87_05605 [Actinobacteria bacterium]|nr:hypothetical protein [Actinomycetota bacterium]
MRVGTLISGALAALGLVLFLVKVNYLGEGYEGSWDTVVLVAGWLSILAALVVAGLTTFRAGARWGRRL